MGGSSLDNQGPSEDNLGPLPRKLGPLSQKLGPLSQKLGPLSRVLLVKSWVLLAKSWVLPFQQLQWCDGPMVHKFGPPNEKLMPLSFSTGPGPKLQSGLPVVLYIIPPPRPASSFLYRLATRRAAFDAGAQTPPTASRSEVLCKENQKCE